MKKAASLRENADYDLTAEIPAEGVAETLDHARQLLHLTRAYLTRFGDDSA